MDRVTRSFNEALSALKRRDFTRAEEQFRKVIRADKSHVPALNLLTVVLMGLRRFAEAERFIAKAVSLNRTSDVSFYNYGLISKELGKHRQAYEQFSEALKLNPNVPETWNNRGTICNDLEEYEQALSDLDRAIALSKEYAEAHANRGKSLQLLKRYDEALSAYDMALFIKPGLAEAWLGKGELFATLSQYHDALVAYDKALSFRSDLAQAWAGRGTMLLELDRYGEALAGFDKALSLKQDLDWAWFGRGNALLAMKRFENALAAFDRALLLNPGSAAIKSSRLQAKMQSCDWSGYQDECAHLISSVNAGEKATPPFYLLAVESSARQQRRCAEIFAEDRYPPTADLVPRSHQRRADKKIRLAYLSSDYRGHPISQLITGLFESHDRSRFEVIGLSVGPDDGSDLRKRIERTFDRFVDMATLTDRQMADEIARLDVDILVDLNGLTAGARTGALRYRPSPIQVNYLGYPGSMGCSFVDYIIADRILIPEDDKQFYSENIVWLPHSYQVNDRKRDVADARQVRGDFGLPNDAFVFCCFNNHYKITPGMFDCWMAILARSAESVLWLSRASEVVAGNLRNEAQKRNVDPARLVFAEHLPSPADHLARHRLADLFLDTLPYNAHTTASDALWAGLPVLTRIGETFAGRVAASLLNAVGLPELITHSREEYESLALELAANRERLLDIRARLETNRLTKPLFDTALFARHIEAAYAEMFRRHRAGLPPDDMDIRNLTAVSA